VPTGVTSTVWYFAYGSNMQRATFCGRRGIEYRQALPARVEGWRLVIDKPPLVPVGEGFANIIPEPGAEVLGVLYEITDEDLAHVDLTEGVLIGNYERVEVTVSALGGQALEVVAATLVSDKRNPELLPSDRYMQCLISGAEEHGLPAEYVAQLRAIPCRPESDEAKTFRPFLDEALRHAIDGKERGRKTEE
jgi:gliotoxin/aspirochlorine biosynthesis gamma-glutamylcyclotransferase